MEPVNTLSACPLAKSAPWVAIAHLLLVVHWVVLLVRIALKVQCRIFSAPWGNIVPILLLLQPIAQLAPIRWENRLPASNALMAFTVQQQPVRHCYAHQAIAQLVQVKSHVSNASQARTVQAACQFM